MVYPNHRYAALFLKASQTNPLLFVKRRQRFVMIIVCWVCNLDHKRQPYKQISIAYMAGNKFIMRKFKP